MQPKEKYFPLQLRLDALGCNNYYWNYHAARLRDLRIWGHLNFFDRPKPR